MLHLLNSLHKMFTSFIPLLIFLCSAIDGFLSKKWRFPSTPHLHCNKLICHVPGSIQTISYFPYLMQLSFSLLLLYYCLLFDNDILNSFYSIDIRPKKPFTTTFLINIKINSLIFILFYEQNQLFDFISLKIDKNEN